MGDKFKFVKSQIDGFHVHNSDLAQIFKSAGNPKSLKIVAQPDTHVRQRDFAAVNAFLQFIKFYNPHGHIIMGDFLDAEAISHWPNDQLRHRNFVEELVEARELLQAIVKATPKSVLRVYLEGNHEDWINQAMAARMPEFFMDLEKLGLMPDLRALLDLDKFKYRLFPVNHIFQLGDANFTHGLYTGANHPGMHLKRLKANIYYGHIHDEIATHETSISGSIEAASLGCLCRLDAPFMKGKPTNWRHGFSTFEFFIDGTFIRNHIRILNGKISFNGRIFDGN